LEDRPWGYLSQVDTPFGSICGMQVGSTPNNRIWLFVPRGPTASFKPFSEKFAIRNACLTAARSGLITGLIKDSIPGRSTTLVYNMVKPTAAPQEP
jgi:hypothetical protein